jgi:hypothetical protein
MFGENKMLPVDNPPRVDEMMYVRCSVYCKRVQRVRLPRHLGGDTGIVWLEHEQI